MDGQIIDGLVFLHETEHPKHEYFRQMINGLVAYIELEHEIVKWTSSYANSLALICIYGVALRQMAQRNVEWYSVHTNGVVLCRIALQSITRSSSTSICLAVHEIFRCCGKSSSLLVA